MVTIGLLALLLQSSATLPPGTAPAAAGLLGASVETVDQSEMMHQAVWRCQARVAPLGSLTVRQVQHRLL